MKNYIIYNKITGKILQQITCPENMIQQQIGQDRDFIEYYRKIDDSQTKINPNTKKIQRLIPKKEIISKEKLEKTKKERLIRQKMNEILRRLAVDELIKEGKLS